jgi:hypothetical protein
MSMVGCGLLPVPGVRGIESTYRSRVDSSPGGRVRCRRAVADGPLHRSGEGNRDADQDRLGNESINNV